MPHAITVALAQLPRESSLSRPRGEMGTEGTHIAEDLGIHLSSKAEEELFKWFLVCLLFGKPIRQQVAMRAFLTFVTARLLKPDAILGAGWDKLVRLLDEAHYVRYDFSTATKLLHICKDLKERYGTLTNLLAQSKTPRELSARLQEFKSIGPKTAEIFLREVRPIWYPSGRPAERN
jgi:endonuclease III